MYDGVLNSERWALYRFQRVSQCRLSRDVSKAVVVRGGRKSEKK